MQLKLCKHMQKYAKICKNMHCPHTRMETFRKNIQTEICKNMPKYAMENMHQICKYMQKYTDNICRNMYYYARH